MRKKPQTFTLSDETMEMLKAYANRQSWSQSLSVEKILKNFLSLEVGGKKNKEGISGPYIDTPEDKKTEKEFLINMEKKHGKKNENKSAEDTEFEKSIAETLAE